MATKFGRGLELSGFYVQREGPSGWRKTTIVSKGERYRFVVQLKNTRSPGSPYGTV